METGDHKARLPERGHFDGEGEQDHRRRPYGLPRRALATQTMEHETVNRQRKEDEPATSAALGGRGASGGKSMRLSSSAWSRLVREAQAVEGKLRLSYLERMSTKS